MTQEYDCPSAGRAETARLYLAGRLADAEAEAFEEHFFLCPECREDVTRGSELRVALGRPAIAVPVPARRSSGPWLALAAAAAIAFLGIGLWQLRRQAEMGATISRAAGGAIANLVVSAGADGGLDLSWAAPREAASYEIQVFSPDGRRLWKTDTRESRAHIAPGVLVPEGDAFEIRVEAFDVQGQLVASGEIASKAKR